MFIDAGASNYNQKVFKCCKQEIVSDVNLENDMSLLEYVIDAKLFFGHGKCTQLLSSAFL